MLQELQKKQIAGQNPEVIGEEIPRNIAFFLNKRQRNVKMTFRKTRWNPEKNVEEVPKKILEKFTGTF